MSGTSTAAATTRTKTHAAGGTLAYRAPETFGGVYTTSSEVYSFAIVLFELLTGEKPWHRDAEGRPYMEVNVISLVTKGKRPELPSNIISSNRLLAALMRRCWSQAPKKRPSFDTIVDQLKPQLPHRPSSGKQIAKALEEMHSIKESVSELHIKVEAVDQHVQSGVSVLAGKLDAAETRLVRELQEGNLGMLRHIQLLHGSLLPEIQCVIAQQTLELAALRQVSDSGGGTGVGVMGWLFGSKQEEEERLIDAQRCVKSAVEMADAKLRASAAAASVASDNASAEILAKLVKMQAAMEEAVSKEADQSCGKRADEVLSKLDEMSSHLAQMDVRMMEMRLEADEHAQEQARRMALVHAKLDALLTGSHEQVFRHFILVPKPYKGYAGRAIDKLKPRHWFAKPMLLVPLYRAANGELKRAPVSVANGGFEVARPFEFVRKHPRVVQVAMLVLKAGITMGAAQLGVAIPAESLNALSAVTDALVHDTLQLAIEEVAGSAAALQQKAEPSDASQALSERDSKIEIDHFLAKEAAAAPPDEVLERLASSDEYKAASRNEYALLKEWLDQLHPGWQARCGLEPTVDKETGRVEWRPV